MKILAIGERLRTEELKQKLSLLQAELVCVDDVGLTAAKVNDFDIIFDLNFDDRPHQSDYLTELKHKVAFLSAVKIQLADALKDYETSNNAFFGFNALPGFINRSLAEVSLFRSGDQTRLQEVMKELNWAYKCIEDRVGMVSPRILFMIMNEACFTLQEGTASVADIDTSMKLGTNYPMGPFEWADKIGINCVYETLDAVYHDTHDERYKICPLLKTKYLKGEKFYL